MRPAFLIGGLAGAAGVALSAYAAHAGGTNVATAAQMLLFHAPAFLVLGVVPRSRLFGAALLVLAVGVLLFSGDLMAREILGHRLFPMAAPAGGLAMIGGWMLLAIAGIVTRRS